jgi:N-acetylglucosaminyl-diphospho-decaprenol L-rhamnosyltransferase
MKENNCIVVSIVSHGQAKLVQLVLTDLDRIAKSTPLVLVITNNIPEVHDYTNATKNCSIHLLNNIRPRGFAQNHNTAFSLVRGSYYCIMNPDIRIEKDPFPELIEALQDSKVGVVSPRILSAVGNREDSARVFPTPMHVLKRFLGLKAGVHEIAGTKRFEQVDWFAGMFMLFPSSVFQTVRGFDERFFLYCEDIDICARVWASEFSVVVCNLATAIHDARRTSRKQLRYLLLHVRSYFLYFSIYRLKKPKRW